MTEEKNEYPRQEQQDMELRLKQGDVAGWNAWIGPWLERYFAHTGDALDLTDIELQGLDLRGVNLAGVNLSGVNFFETNLEGANLENALLFEATLVAANLTRANLRFAKLPDVSLEATRLHYANLEGAHLEGVKLSDAVGIASANFYGARVELRARRVILAALNEHLYDPELEK